MKSGAEHGGLTECSRRLGVSNGVPSDVRAVGLGIDGGFVLGKNGGTYGFIIGNDYMYPHRNGVYVQEYKNVEFADMKGKQAL